MGRTLTFPQRQITFVSFKGDKWLHWKMAMVGSFSEKSVGLIKEVIIRLEEHMTHHSSDG